MSRAVFLLNRKKPAIAGWPQRRRRSLLKVEDADPTCAVSKNFFAFFLTLWAVWDYRPRFVGYCSRLAFCCKCVSASWGKLGLPPFDAGNSVQSHAAILPCSTSSSPVQYAKHHHLNKSCRQMCMWVRAWGYLGKKHTHSMVSTTTTWIHPLSVHLQIGIKHRELRF
jgi:hypothetical protein